MKVLLAHFFSRLPALSWTSERGATATEYSILLAFIVLAMMAGIQVLGLALNDVYIWLADEWDEFLALP